MRSIRARLTVPLLGGMGLLILLAGLLLEIDLSRSLEREFDRALEAKARALVTLTKQHHGEVELDFADELMPEFESPADPHYFELWLDGTTLLERSHSFAAGAERSRAALPRQPGLSAAPRFADLRLPDGRRGRLVRIDFVPQVESPDDPASAAAGEESPEHEPARDPAAIRPGSGFHAATLLVAGERETLDARIGRLRWSFALGAALLLAAVAALVALALEVGLRPLDRLALQVRQLGADSLDRRVDLGTPPRELAPVVEQLNELLARLETAFRRERRLTSDIAHELKTPIAELRALAEVGGRWPDDREATHEFFADAAAIGVAMERIVVNLLALARYDEGAERVSRERVALAELIGEAWRPLAPQAEGRELVLCNRVAADASLETDADKLRLILTNLLANAVAYGRAETAITCTFERADGSSSLGVANYVVDLAAEDLGPMFDRFWRKDAARSGGRNAGLGLALVRAFSDLLGLELATDLDAAGLFRITLSQPE